MTRFNIIYTSPSKDFYLWNGNGFDKLRGSDTASLLFSGTTYKNEDLPTVFPKCREVLHKKFPNDNTPKLNTIEIAIGPNRS